MKQSGDMFNRFDIDILSDRGTRPTLQQRIGLPRFATVPQETRGNGQRGLCGCEKRYTQRIAAHEVHKAQLHVSEVLMYKAKHILVKHTTTG